jgi:nucleotide-binding universal stress UspA family protein
MMSGETIVVGYDGSVNSGRALRWATHEAIRRQARVKVLSVWDPSPVRDWSAATIEEWWIAAHRQSQAGTRQATRLSEGRVQVEGVVREGKPGEVLVAEAQHALMLVVGSAGHIGMTGAFAGSVSRQCVRRATRPVVVVGPRFDERPVERIVTSDVLDLDGSVSSWLVPEMARNPLPVLVVDAWTLASVTRMTDLVVVPRSAMFDVNLLHETCPVMFLPQPPAG